MDLLRTIIFRLIVLMNCFKNVEVGIIFVRHYLFLLNVCKYTWLGIYVASF